MLELQNHGEFIGWPLRKVESDPRPNRLRLAGLQQVHDQSKVCLFVQTPGHSVGLKIGWSAGSPCEESAVEVGIAATELAIHRHRPRVIHFTVGSMQGLGAVDHDVAMVNNLGISGLYLDSPYIVSSGEGYGQHETRPRVSVGTREYNVGLRQLND